MIVFQMHLFVCSLRRTHRRSCVLDTGEKVERIRYSASECITKSISISGLPLHLYLSRKKNVDLEIVKLLISIYPDSINQKEGGRFPVNLAIKNNADINIIAYLMIYSSEDVGDMLLHTVYSSQSIFPIDLVNMIIKKFPRSLQRKNNSKCLPIHTLCKNDAMKFDKEDYFYDLLQLLIKQCPEHVQCSTAGGTLPLHLYLSHSSRRGRKENKYHLNLHAVQVLVEAYPDALYKLSGNDNYEYGYRDPHSQQLPIQVAISNQKHNYVTIKYLVQKSSLSNLRSIDFGDGKNLLHAACSNHNATADVAQLLMNTLPELKKQKDDEGNLPIGTFCQASTTLKSQASTTMKLEACIEQYSGKDVQLERFKILKVLILHDPASVKVANNNGDLPIHSAACSTDTPEFCKLLINTFPESLSQRNQIGNLPIHIACTDRKPSVVNHMVKTLPECVNIPSEERGFRMDWLPLHIASYSGRAEIVQCLLSHNCEGLSQATSTGCLPLHLVCCALSEYVRGEPSNSRNVNFTCVKVIFDSNPAAILMQDNMGRTPTRIVSDIVSQHNRSQSAKAISSRVALYFLEKQNFYVQMADNMQLLSTQDENGRLLLHRALQDDDCALGSVKMLLTGYPHAASVHDHQGVLPLHIASEFRGLDFVKCLLDNSSNDDMQSVCDMNKDYSLHRACRGGKCENVSYLLQRSSVAITSRNIDGKLPIELLIESSCDKDSKEYVGAIWHMIKANPDVVD